MSDIAAILLAAGESSRMGRSKALLPWQGKTLLAHQIAALMQGGADRVIVVLGHRPETLKPVVEGHEGASWVVNPHYAQGKTTSIIAGLDALGQDVPSIILILNVDQPRSASTIRDLIQHHRDNGGQITIPTHGGKGGHPILLDPALLPELKSITEEMMGVKAVVRAHQNQTHRTEVSTAEVLWDLNTPEEYEAALRSGS